MSDRDPGLTLDAALYDPDPVVRDEARGWVARHGAEELVRPLIDLLDAHHRMTRRRAARILSEVRPERARPALVTALEDTARPARLRASAARILSVLAAESEPALAGGMRDPDPRVRRACATPAAPVADLERGLADDDPTVLERVAASLEALNHEPSPALVRSALAKAGPEPPSALLRMLARLEPASERLVEAAGRGDPTALDHLADPTALRGLLDGEHRVAGAWGLSRLGEVPGALLDDADPRIRAAAVRGLSAEDGELSRCCEDPDVGVRWLARQVRLGNYEAEALAVRIQPHDRADAPSAKPPYGLRSDDLIPDVVRAHAALALCHTRFDVNLGVAVRSAEAAGLREVFLVGRGDLFRSPARGTDLLLPIRHAPDPAALIRFAREGGYQIVGVQQTPRSVPYHQADYPPRPLFVLGAEDDGLPRALRIAADLLVEIPLRGVIDSLNVAAAATCVMFQWAAGLESGHGDGLG